MSEPIEADEVIPPQGPHSRFSPPGANPGERQATAKIIARWLDDLLRVPGTNFKIGLDPLLAFIPGIGDFLSSSVSAVVILEAVRKGVSLSVILRMGLNVLVNALFDAIPGAGPFLSAFFKSNSRNLQLLQRWQEGGQREVRRSSRQVLLAVVGIISLCVLISLLGWMFYFWLLLKLVHG
jgi:hypothetical protein